MRPWLPVLTLALLPTTSTAQTSAVSETQFADIFDCSPVAASKADRFEGLDSGTSEFLSCDVEPLGYPATVTGQFIGGGLVALRYRLERRGPGWEPSRFSEPAKELLASLNREFGSGDESSTLTTRLSEWENGVRLRYVPSGSFSTLEVTSIPDEKATPAIPSWLEKPVGPRRGIRETSTPKVIVPGYYEAKTWRESGEEFEADWRSRVIPGAQIDSVRSLLPKPQVTERVNSEVWLVWEYIRSEGKTRSVAFGPSFTSSSEEGLRLRVQVREDVVQRWTFEQWSPGQRLQEDSDWYFGPEETARRREEKSARSRPAPRIEVGFEEAFED